MAGLASVPPISDYVVQAVTGVRGRIRVWIGDTGGSNKRIKIQR